MDYEQLRKESQQLEREIRLIKAQLNKLPKGKIVFSHTGKYCKWYQSDVKNKVYIPKKDRHLAERLAMKKYLSLRLEDISSRKEIIDNCLNHQIIEMRTAEKLLAESSEYQKLLSPYFANKSKELEEWKQADYKKNQKHPEHLQHKSISGNILRSKSEVLIDIMLYSNKIPYRYEEVIQLGNKTIVPDFIIKHPATGELFYWEHFGMMDNPDYAKNACDKIRLYSLNGIIPSKQLILTYETKDDPLNPNEVKKIIEDYFL